MREYAIQPNGNITVFEDGNAAGSFPVNSKGYYNILKEANKERTANGKKPFKPDATHEKHFIGKRISGNGYEIYFDPKAERTRIIFDHDPKDTEKKAVTDAGFYYSSVLKSYNKKLTFKAYRAAVKVAETLDAIA